MCARNRALIVAHANGFALSRRRLLGTRRRTRAHVALTSGVIFASALKHPNVTNPALAHGAGATLAGASGLGS
jgi:hypothetical protein